MERTSRLGDADAWPGFLRAARSEARDLVGSPGCTFSEHKRFCFVWSYTSLRACIGNMRCDEEEGNCCRGAVVVIISPLSINRIFIVLRVPVPPPLDNYDLATVMSLSEERNLKLNKGRCGLKITFIFSCENWEHSQGRVS